MSEFIQWRAHRRTHRPVVCAWLRLILKCSLGELVLYTVTGSWILMSHGHVQGHCGVWPWPSLLCLRALWILMRTYQMGYPNRRHQHRHRCRQGWTGNHINKKWFQLNVNLPLSDRPCFELWILGRRPYKVRSNWSTSLSMSEMGDKMKDTTEKITVQKPCWRAVINHK